MFGLDTETIAKAGEKLIEMEKFTQRTDHNLQGIKIILQSFAQILDKQTILIENLIKQMEEKKEPENV